MLPEVAGMPTYTRDHLTDWSFAGQAILGVEFPVSENWSLVTSARYLRPFHNFAAQDQYDVFRGHLSSIRPSAFEDDQIYYNQYIPDESLHSFSVGAYVKVGFGGKNRRSRGHSNNNNLFDFYRSGATH